MPVLPIANKPKSSSSKGSCLPQRSNFATAVAAPLLVIFDGRVSELEVLYRALQPGAIAYTLNTQDDALAVITQLLTETGATQLAIVAHGEPGVVTIGSHSLTRKQLQTRSALLQEWNVEAIALYSCEVAKGDRGWQFIHTLSELTGAAIAASSTPLGCAALGGNWQLDRTVGAIDDYQIFTPEAIATYDSLMANATIISIPTSVFLTPIDYGWYNQYGFHNPTNTNTYTGESGGVEYRSFFVFNQSYTAPAGVLTGANLQYFYSFQVLSDQPQETFEIRQVTTDANSLIAGNAGLTGFNDLGDGPVYGSFSFSNSFSYQYFGIPLNSNGLDFLSNTAQNTSSSNLITFGGRLVNLTPGGNPEVIFSFSDYQNYLSLSLTLANLTATGSVTEDAGSQLTTSGNLAISDTDPGQAIFSPSVTSSPSNLGSLSITENGRWTYSVNNNSAQYLSANAQRVETFTVRSLDGTASQTINITVIGINDTPRVANQIAPQTAAEDTFFNFILPANTFSDVDIGDTLTYTARLSDGSPLPTWLNFNAATRTFSGTPTQDHVGNLNLRVTATDQSGAAVSSVFNLAIASTNDAPTGIASAALATGTEDQPYTFSAARLLEGFSDEDGDILTVANVTATNGSLVNNNDGTYTFIPNANFNGPVTLSYTVIDGNGGAVAATQSFNLNPVNDAPVIDLNGVVDGTDLATAFTEDAGAISIAPDLSLTDVDSLQANIATVRINNLRNPGFEFLTANTGNTSITATYHTDFGILELRGWDSIENYQHVLRSVTYNNTSSSPTAGDRTLQFSINDSMANSNQAIATVTVNPINDAPTGSSNTVAIAEDSTHTFTVADFGFSDGDGNAFNRVRITMLPAAGRLTLNGTEVAPDGWVDVNDIVAGNFQFTPSLNANGTNYASFQFQVEDNGDTANGGVNLDPTPKTFTFNLTAVNDPVTGSPTATLAPGLEDSAYVVTMADLLTGFSDVDIATNGQVLSVINLSTSNGTVTDNQDGTFTITPSPNFNGSVTLSYDVTDSNGSTLTAQTLSYIITPVNDAPVIDLNGAADGTGLITSFTEDSGAIAIASPNLTLTDVDSPQVNIATVRITNLLDGQSEILAADTANTSIAATYFADFGILELRGWDSLENYQRVLQSVTYNNTSQNPTAGDRTIAFAVNDAMANSNTAITTVNVIATNDAPTLTGQPATLGTGTEDTVYTIVAAELLAGFTDLDGDRISIANLTATNGSLSAFDPATGTWIFTPTANYNGWVTLNYTVTDSLGGTTAATQVFNLTAVNDAPFLQVPSAQLVNLPTFTISRVRVSDVDAGDSLLEVTLTAQNGVLSMSSQNGLSFTVGDGSQDSDITVRGTLTDINAALSTLAYSSHSGYYGNDILSLTVNDLGNTGMGGALTDHQTIALSTAYRFLQGTNASETFQPTSVTDWIVTAGGNDIVIADVTNLQQNDRIDGGDGIDHFILTGGTAAMALTLDLTNTTNQLSGITGLTLSNFEQFDFSHFSGSLTAIGSSQDDTIKAGQGTDSLTGGAGNDFLYLGLNDKQIDLVVYNVGDGQDTVFEFGANKNRDMLEFRGIAAIDIVDNGCSTLFRLSDGIAKNPGFGTGETLLELHGVTGLGASILKSLVPNNTTFLLK